MAKPRKTTAPNPRPRKPAAPAKKPAARDAGRLDPRAVALIASLRADPRLGSDFEATRAAPSRKFGSNGLKVNGKLFALFTQGTLVVKLPRDRVAALVAAKVGKPFDPGHGRLMKEWLTVTDADAPWIVLAREAYRFVGG